MKRTKANISLWVGGTEPYAMHEINAYETDVPGLVVHRRHRWNAETSTLELVRGWTITQQPTGLAVRWGFRTGAYAVAFVNKLAEVDWSFTDVAGCTKAHGTAVRKAIDITDREGLPG